jgi:hypothetical protein
MSRRARDPQIGSPERRQNQRAGLDAKYTYRERGKARLELQKLGLVPTTSWSEDGEPRSFSQKTYDPILWRRKQRATMSWLPSDGWWLSETMLGVGNNAHRQTSYRRLDEEEWSLAVGQWVRTHRQLRGSPLQRLADKLDLDISLAASPWELLWFDPSIDPIVRRRLENRNALPAGVWLDTFQGLERAGRFFVAATKISVTQHTEGKELMTAAEAIISHVDQRFDRIERLEAMRGQAMDDVRETVAKLARRFPDDERVQDAVAEFLGEDES